MIAATIVCALAVVLLVIGEYLDNDRIRFSAKPLASLAFLVVGGLALAHDKVITDFELAVMAGLILGAIGDMALMFEQGFLAGLVSFLLGHVAYVVAVGTQIPPRMWFGAAGVFAFIPVIVGLGALGYLWPKLGKLRVPVIVYVAVIITMVIAALALYLGNDGAVARGELWQHLLPNQRALFAIGAVMFFISDLAVARDKFVAKGFSNRVWGLPVYYGAQLLIAWSMVQ